MPSDFENQLPELLQRYLDPVAPTQDTVAGVRRRHADHLYPRYREQRLPLVPMVSVALLVVLLVGAVTWLRVTSPATPGAAKTPTPDTITPPNGILTDNFPIHPIAHSPTVSGITLYVEDFYADATRTAIHYALTGAQAGPGAHPIVYITDSAGYTLTSSAIASESAQGNSRGTDNFTELAPLPPADLGTTQTLTVRVSNVPLANVSQSDPSPVWKTAFTAAIPAAQSVSALPAAQQSGGVTMQITHVDWSHATEKFDGEAAGVRLILHLTGLPPNQPYTSFHFSTRFATQSGESATLDGGTIFSLIGQWGGASPPAIALGLDSFDLAHQGLSENVGANGEADIEIVFLLPNVPTSGTATLTLPRLALSAGTANGDSPEQSIPGPWTFQIPIS